MKTKKLTDNSYDYSGSISFFPNSVRRGLQAQTHIKYFSKPFTVKNDRINGRLEFKRPTFEDNKVYNSTHKGNLFQFYIFMEDLEPGKYSDFEIVDESLFLYYR